MHWSGYGWGMGYGGVFMIVFWVLVIAAVAFLVRTVGRKNDGAARNETSKDILDRRYAKGEITREEYGRMKDDLSKA